MAAPHIPEKLLEPLLENYNANPTIESAMTYDIKIHDFFEEPRWEPYRQHFARLNFVTCWTIPLRRSLNKVCTLAVFLNSNKKPNSKDLKYIEKKKQLFDKWFPDCPAMHLMNKSSS